MTSDVIETINTARTDIIASAPRNRMLFDEKVLGFCNYHNFIRVDAPGFGDC